MRMNIKDRIYFRISTVFMRMKQKRALNRHKLSYKELGHIPVEYIEMLETTSNYVKEVDVLLDIGAHRGLFAQMANRFFQFEQTICFEPNKQMNAEIKRHVPQATIANIALTDKEGETSFEIHSDSTMSSVVGVDPELLRTEFTWDDPDKLQRVTVPTQSLDGYIAEQGLEGKRFLLKIDTQGNELSVLQHGLQTLCTTQALLIEFMFFSPYQSQFSFLDIVQFLDQQGFECQGALSISKRKSHKVSAVDFLFVKKA